MASGVIIRDLGYKRIMGEMAEMHGQTTLVGLHNDGTAQDGVLVAHYGAINEFGGDRIPERSFMRSTFDEKVGVLNSLIQRLITGVSGGRISAMQAGRLLGEVHQQDVQAKISSGVPPPNAPYTIARKGSSTTLVDTGLMGNTVRYTIEKKGGSLGLLGRLVGRF